jgi:hypothetical protein
MFRSYISQADVLNQAGIKIAPRLDLLQQRKDHVVNICVFETALLAFCEGRSDGKCDDYIVGVLLSAVCAVRTVRSWCR